MYSFFRFPNVTSKTLARRLVSVKKRQKAWLVAIRRKDLVQAKLKIARVCGCHFTQGHPADLRENGSVDWVPSVSLGIQVSSIPDDSARYVLSNLS